MICLSTYSGVWGEEKEGNIGVRKCVVSVLGVGYFVCCVCEILFSIKRLCCPHMEIVKSDTLVRTCTVVYESVSVVIVPVNGYVDEHAHWLLLIDIGFQIRIGYRYGTER